MTLLHKTRVKYTTSTTGTGTITLGSAATQYQALAAGDNAKIIHYMIEDGGGTDWEEGWGVYTHSGTTLTRNLVSSSSGSLIDLSDTSTVFLTPNAAFFQDQVPNVAAKVAATANVTLATDCEAGDTLNGVVLAAGDVIFTPYQSTAADKRVWVVKASGAPDPHPLMPTGAVISQFLVTVSEGTSEKDRIWLQTANTVTIGSGSPTWSHINPASSDQVANTIYAGPTSGSDAAPTFRAMVAKDAALLPYQSHNLAVNSGFWFASMRKAATSAVSYSDDTYGFDCWNILSQGATALVSQQTGHSGNGLYCMRVQNDTGSSNRVGCCQIIEHVDSFPLRGQTVTFKCRLRCSETKNLRVSVVCSTQTADTVTSDSVGTWTSTTFTSGNFFANYGVGATVLTEQIACTANTWRDAVVSGTFLNVANNAVLVITCDDTLANGEKFDVEEVEFYLGTEVTTARPRASYAVERLRAARFAYDFQGQQYLEGWKANTSQIYGLDIEFPVPMRAEPTGFVTTSPTFNAGAAGAAQVASYNRTAAAYTTITGALTVTATSSAVDRGRIYIAAGTSFSGTNGDFQALDFGSDFHAYWHAFL